MNPQLLASGIFLLLFLVIIAAAHFMYKAHVDTEKSRKFVHLAGGTLSLFLPRYIDNHWYVLGICSVAFITLLITWIRKDLPGIHKTRRKSVGSVLFPVPVYICFFVAGYCRNELLFYIPVSLLTFSDTVAEWGGKRWGRYTKSLFGGRKTIAGGLCFFASAMVIVTAWLITDAYFWNNAPLRSTLPNIIMIALIGTVGEIIGLNGWDNLTIPLFTLGAVWLVILQ